MIINTFFMLYRDVSGGGSMSSSESFSIFLVREIKC